MTCRAALVRFALVSALGAVLVAPLPVQADEVAEQAIYVLAKRAFDRGSFQESIDQCTSLLMLNPNHADGKTLKASATKEKQRAEARASRRASNARWADSYKRFNSNPRGFRLGVGYVIRTSDVYNFDSGGSMDARKVDSAIHEVRFELGGRWSTAKYLLLGMGVLPFFDIPTGGGAAVGGGILARFLIGVPIVPFSDRFGLKFHFTIDWGYRKLRFKSDGETYELQPWYKQVDYGFHLAVQLNRWNLLFGAGVNQNGQPLALFGVE